MNRRVAAAAWATVTVTPGPPAHCQELELERSRQVRGRCHGARTRDSEATWPPGVLVLNFLIQAKLKGGPGHGDSGSDYHGYYHKGC